MGEGTHRDDIHTGGGNGGYGVQVDAPGRFQDRPALSLGHGLCQLRDGHVVQQDRIRAGLDGFLQAGNIFDFHFYLQGVGGFGPGRLNGIGNRTGSGDMVVLDQDAVGTGRNGG